MFLALAAGAFAVSVSQFRERGFLCSNAWFWASREERRRMDENPESKRACYRQSGFAFLCIGICLLFLAAWAASGWIWALAGAGTAVLAAVVYAVVSSVRMEREGRGDGAGSG